MEIWSPLAAPPNSDKWPFKKFEPGPPSLCAGGEGGKGVIFEFRVYLARPPCQNE